MCNKQDKDMKMETAADKNNISQSQSFLKLRRKMQNQMKKNNVDYKDILKVTEKF